MKVLSIFGTRPEMIKMWATLKKLDDLNFDHVMVHTGQNFTPELKDFFFNDLKLRKPDYDLGIDVSSYSNEVSDVIKKTDQVMEDVKPDALLILGDTYSGLSIMPASYRGINIGVKFAEAFRIIFNKLLTILCFGNLIATVSNLAHAIEEILEPVLFLTTKVIGPGQSFL